MVNRIVKFFVEEEESYSSLDKERIFRSSIDTILINGMRQGLLATRFFLLFKDATF